ncbi:hypothetical protein ACFL6L_01535 [candidate division KSB1 bacterium]
MHNLAADLNYTDISEYVVYSEHDALLGPHEQHFHNFTEKPNKICFLCHFLSCSYDTSIDTQFAAILDYQVTVEIYWDTFVYTNHIISNPSLRAPPLV